MDIRFVIIGIVLAGAVIAGFTYWSGQPLSSKAPYRPSTSAPELPGTLQDDPADEPADAAAPDRGEQITDTAPPVLPISRTRDEATPELQPTLPALNDSDAWLLERVATSAPAVWEDVPELLRTFSAVLDNASRGDYPRNLLGFLAPQGSFKVNRDDSLIRLDPVSYRRYAPLVGALTDLSAKDMAETFSSIDPLLREALSELGVSDANPVDLAVTAIAQVQATPVLTKPPLLRQPKVVYQFADPNLEALSPLQKQLLRMGPENLAAVKRWLQEFAAALQ